MLKKKLIILAIFVTVAFIVLFTYSEKFLDTSTEPVSSSSDLNILSDVADRPIVQLGLTEEDRALAASYVKKNIANLSPEEPVLGGNWYTTNIEFLQGNKGRVYYEDGHIAREASFSYVIDGGSVAIFNFYVDPETINGGTDENIQSTSTEIISENEIEDPGNNQQIEEENSRDVLEDEPVFCAMDAMMCPDGSYVGRIAPNCEFAPCPNVN